MPGAFLGQKPVRSWMTEIPRLSVSYQAAADRFDVVFEVHGYKGGKVAFFRCRKYERMWTKRLRHGQLPNGVADFMCAGCLHR